MIFSELSRELSWSVGTHQLLSTCGLLAKVMSGHQLVWVATITQQIAQVVEVVQAAAMIAAEEAVGVLVDPPWGRAETVMMWMSTENALTAAMESLVTPIKARNYDLSHLP